MSQGAPESLKSQAEQLASVKGALESKINNLKGQTAKLNEKEIENMRASISSSTNNTKADSATGGAAPVDGDKDDDKDD